MSEIVVETTPQETIIEIDGGPTLTTVVEQEQQTLVETPAEPIIIDLNSGARGEPGSAILTGTGYPNMTDGSVGDIWLVKAGAGIGDFLIKRDTEWTIEGSLRGPAGGIDTVNGYTGPDVVLQKGDLDLGFVDNTSDLNKPISTATQAAITALSDSAVKLTGNQTIGGNKTLTGNTILTTLTVAAAGNTQVEIGRTDGVASNPLIDFHSGATAADYDSRIIASGGTGTNGQGNLAFTAGTVTFSNNITVSGNASITGTVSGSGAFLTNLNGSNVASGTVADARLSTNVVLLNNAQTITGNKTFGGSAVLAVPEAKLRVGTSTNGVNYVLVGDGSGYATWGNPNLAKNWKNNNDNSSTYTQAGIYIQDSLQGTDWPNKYGLILTAFSSTDRAFQFNIGKDDTRMRFRVGEGASPNGWRPWTLVANDDMVVHLAGTESITGTKTFTTQPIVPTPTAWNHAAHKQYVDDRINSTIDAAPGTLDTLNELAAALGDDPNFATTVTNQIANKADRVGPQTISGKLNLEVNVADKGSSAASLEIRNANPAGMPSIYFHTPGQIDGSLILDLNGDFKFTTNFGTAYRTLRANAFYEDTVRVYSLNNRPVMSDIISGTINDGQLPPRLRQQGSPSVTDWNNVVQSGWYHGSNAANAPTAGWYIGIVSTHDQQAGNRYVTQTVWNFTDTGYDSQKWERRSAGASVWSPWYRIRQYEVELDQRYLVSGTAQTFSGTKTFSGDLNVGGTAVFSGNSTSVIGLQIKPATSDHGYISFYSRSASPTTRTAFVGVGSAGSTQFTIANEMSNGGITLSPNGTGIVTISSGGLSVAAGPITGIGSGLTSLNASNLSTGTVAQARLTQNVTRVVHGSTAGTARPTNSTHVEWVGSVTPTNMATNDTWINTSTTGNTADNQPSGTVAASASAKTTAPAGWYWMEGQEILISGDTALYNEITNNGSVFPYGGNTNGSGAAGSTHFRLPNTKGRTVYHADATTEFASIGKTGGTKTEILGLTQIPSHNHGINDNGHMHNFIGGKAATWSAVNGEATDIWFDTYASGGRAPGNMLEMGSWWNKVDVQGTGISIRYTGGSGGDGSAAAAHNNLAPYLTLRYMIKR